jgi:hypothetical protein
MALHYALNSSAKPGTVKTDNFCNTGRNELQPR